MSNEPETLREVTEALASVAKVAGPITMDTHILHDLNLDFVAVMDLVMVLETRFDTVIPMDRLAEIETVGDLVRMLSTSKRRPAAAEPAMLGKYRALREDHAAAVSATGRNPFGLAFDTVLSATEATLDGRRVLLLGTNNYLGLTFDRDCMAAAVAATEAEGTGTTGSRIANGSYGGHERWSGAGGLSRPAERDGVHHRLPG